jgi:hypothetical protein
VVRPRDAFEARGIRRLALAAVARDLREGAERPRRLHAVGGQVTNAFRRGQPLRRDALLDPALQREKHHERSAEIDRLKMLTDAMT